MKLVTNSVSFIKFLIFKSEKARMFKFRVNVEKKLKCVRPFDGIL